jgi:bis(5'-adenosyl)-triphosphatase
VFYKTSLSFALVNIKPILPGHVLVSPLRRIPRFHDLSAPEVADLFSTVQRVSRTIERVYKASALNIAIQDGEDAGQSVPHVHVHIIPRNKGDLDHRGGSDAIYRMMDGEEGSIRRHIEEAADSKGRSNFPSVDSDDQRKPRTEEEMKKEAEWLAEETEKDSNR